MRHPKLFGAGASLAVAGLLALLANATIATSSIDPSRSTKLSSADAVARAQAFVGTAAKTSDLTAEPPVDGTIERFYMVEGAAVMVGVNAHDGHIISCLFESLIPSGTETKLNPDEAIAAARAFLGTHDTLTPDLAPSVEVINHGEGVEYTVTWTREVGGVIVPDEISVGVDASTGAVFRYLRQIRAYDPPPKPVVDEATAVKLAIEASGLTGATAKATTLRVTFTPSGTQDLVWDVELSSQIETGPTTSPVMVYAWVNVDSQSGAASVIARG